MEDLGIQKIRRHGSQGGIFDILGLASGNASLGNLSLLEAYLDKTEGSEQHRHLVQRLHSYIGVKYRALDAKVDIMRDFIGKIEKNDNYIREQFN